MDVLFDKSGIPVMAYGSSTLIKISGTSSQKYPQGINPLKPITFAQGIGGYEVSRWGSSNNFPQIADELIGKIGVLNTGLRYIRNVILGQGIFPCKVVGYDDDGNEALKIIEDSAISRFCYSRKVRKYMEKSLRDFLKYGSAFTEFIFNQTGTQIVGINTINALYCRYSVADNFGEIGKCIVSGRWPEMPSEANEFKVLSVLSDYDPEEDLNRRKLKGSLAQGSVIYPFKDSWSNKDYYSAPAWWPVKEAGWLEIAELIPKFLKKAYENQISWKWHVKIPYAYFEKRFPQKEFKTDDERKAAISQFLLDIEKNLTSPENANKAIITMFEVGPGGKAEEQWEITNLDNKYKDNEQLITSAAANSEILFSLMINPNVLGAGMPGGPYAGNQGGSNIREAFLVNIANAWPDRQSLLDPIEAYMRFNGATDVELRFRNTVLTTLDSGIGTNKANNLPEEDREDMMLFTEGFDVSD